MTHGNPLRQYTYRFASNLSQLSPGFIADKPHESLPPVPKLLNSGIFWSSLFLRCPRKWNFKFITSISSVLIKVQDEKTVPEMFREATFDDLWCECSDLRDVLLYCRGSKRLSIPSHWRSVLPERLWGIHGTTELLGGWKCGLQNLIYNHMIMKSLGSHRN